MGFMQLKSETCGCGKENMSSIFGEILYVEVWILCNLHLPWIQNQVKIGFSRHHMKVKSRRNNTLSMSHLYIKFHKLHINMLCCGFFKASHSWYELQFAAHSHNMSS